MSWGPQKQYFVLVHQEHRRTALDRDMFNAHMPRMLNANGRWCTRPTRAMPLLVWTEPHAAEQAAARCGQARKADVGVGTWSSSSDELGKNLVAFQPHHEHLLANYLSVEQVAIRQQADTRLRVLAAAAYLVGNVGGDPALLARSKELAPKAGAGAPDFLLGKTGRPVAEGILSGALEADGLVTREIVALGLELARGLIRHRDPPPQPY